jgi:hypothetical protein
MANMVELAKDMAVSPDGLMHTAGRIHFSGQIPEKHDANTALTASTTWYQLIGKLPVPAVLVSGVIRSEAKGVGASTVLDILKVASGTDLAGGTTLVTQVATNGLTDDTDYPLTVTAAAKACAKGSMIYAKLVTQGSEVLKPLLYDLEFQV